MNLIILLKSRLARRLIFIFLSLVSVPVLVTVLFLSHVSKDQIVGVGVASRKINSSALADAGTDFQHLGREAIRKSVAGAASVSKQSVTNAATNIHNIQIDALSKTGADLTKLSLQSVSSAMNHSVETNRGTLHRVGQDVAATIEKSSAQASDMAGRDVERTMMSLVSKSLQERADYLAFLVNNHVETHINYLVQTAQVTDLSNHDLQGQLAFIDALQRRYPVYMLLTVLDAQGNATAVSASDHAVSNRDYTNHKSEMFFKTAIRDEQYVGMEPITDPNQAPVLDLAVPIELYHGKAVGVLAARLSLADLWDTVRATRIGKQGYAEVYDAKGRPLLRRKRGPSDTMVREASIDKLGWEILAKQPMGEALAPIAQLKRDILTNTLSGLVEMRKHMAVTEAQAASRLQDDATVLSGKTASEIRRHTDDEIARLESVTSRQTDMQLTALNKAVLAQSDVNQAASDRAMVSASAAATLGLTKRIKPLTENALQEANSTLSKIAFIILAISSVIGCILALILANKIVRPILMLADGTRAIASGDLDSAEIFVSGYETKSSDSDEISDLAASFNCMALSLKRSMVELHGAEAQLVQSAKLASLGTLSAGVAHELNQPVAIIRGITQQLVADPTLNEDALADLELIEGQTGRMMKIIKHLRTFSRVGGAELGQIDVNSVIRDCFILIGAQLKAHDIAVELDLTSSGLPVLGDANELEQVFLNLITNARDAVEGSAEPRLTIRSRLSEGRAVVEFCDNGTGVPDSVIRQIFDPFFTTKEAGKGTGLGLSISHTIIEKHSGTIAVHNDGGAVFVLTFPLETADEDADNEVEQIAA